MHIDIQIDWKSFAAIGAAFFGSVLLNKIDSDAAERVLTYIVDTLYQRLPNSNR